MAHNHTLNIPETKDGLENEVRARREVIDRICSSMWWCAVLFCFSTTFSLSVWAITGNWGIAIEGALILAAAYVSYRFVRWLFADVTWSGLKIQMEFVVAADRRNAQPPPTPSSVLPAGT